MQPCDVVLGLTPRFQQLPYQIFVVVEGSVATKQALLERGLSRRTGAAMTGRDNRAALSIISQFIAMQSSLSMRNAHAQVRPAISALFDHVQHLYAQLKGGVRRELQDAL